MLQEPGPHCTPHPAGDGLGPDRTPITTDYSESQIELITGAHQSVSGCLDELIHIHQYVLRTLAGAGGEMLVSPACPATCPRSTTSPGPLWATRTISARQEHDIYRMVPGDRYGRRMQTISGIHYNWSLPGVTSEEYFALIRNFRRHAFVLLYLFGASPALCPCFVEGRTHSLQPMGDGSQAMHLPHATSLRMGRLGYQSDAQASPAS